MNDGLTESDIALIRNSFDRMWSASGRIVDMFYVRLFEIAPETRQLFRGDMELQKRKFVATLAMIVGSLDDTAGLFSAVDRLARNHVGYGARRDYYEPVGIALLWAMERGLAPGLWTDDTAAAWRKAYAMLSSRMIAVSDRAA